jgi:hypothetical protein
MLNVNEDSGVIHIYQTALYSVIALTRAFKHGCSLLSLTVLMMIGMVLIVNMF